MPKPKNEARFYMRSPAAVMEQADRLAKTLNMTQPDLRRLAFVMGVRYVENMLDQMINPGKYFSAEQFGRAMKEALNSGFQIPGFSTEKEEDQEKLMQFLSREDVALLIMDLQNKLMSSGLNLDGEENSTTT